MPSSRIALLGRSHKNASVEIRDQLSLTAQMISEFIQASQLQDSPLDEIAILSTCNRTEFYCVSKQCEQIYPWIIEQYSKIKKIELSQNALPCLILFDDNVVRHLFAVASGLESMVLGENQILSQVKSCYDLLLSHAKKQAPLLNRLLQEAIKSGKAVRTETALCQGAVSISLAGVELARKIFTNFSRHKVLLVGAGETSELVAMHLRNFGATQFTIANRSRERAEKLAAKFSAQIIGLDEIPSVLNSVDIIVVATNSQNYLITYEQVERVFRERQRLLLMLDISTPRNIDPRIGLQWSEVFLYNIDDLQNVVGANIKKREGEIPKSRAIMDRFSKDYWTWVTSLEVAPTISKLVKQFEEVRENELKKFVHKVSPTEYKQMEKLSNGLIKKLMYYPISSLNQMSANDNVDISKIDLISDIYQLRKVEKNNKVLKKK